MKFFTQHDKHTENNRDYRTPLLSAVPRSMPKLTRHRSTPHKRQRSTSVTIFLKPKQTSRALHHSESVSQLPYSLPRLSPTIIPYTSPHYFTRGKQGRRYQEGGGSRLRRPLSHAGQGRAIFDLQLQVRLGCTMVPVWVLYINGRSVCVYT